MHHDSMLLHFRVRATVKLSAAFFHESSITMGGAGGGYKSAIAPMIHGTSYLAIKVGDIMITIIIV